MWCTDHELVLFICHHAQVCNEVYVEARVSRLPVTSIRRRDRMDRCGRGRDTHCWCRLHFCKDIHSFNDLRPAEVEERNVDVSSCAQSNLYSITSLYNVMIPLWIPESISDSKQEYFTIAARKKRNINNLKSLISTPLKSFPYWTEEWS